MHRSRRRYTESQKAEALAILVANEGNIKGTARQLQIPEKTLAGWRDEEPRLLAQDQEQKEIQANAVKMGKRAGKLPGLSVAELRAQKKEDAASAFMDIAWMCLTRLSQSDLLETSTRITDLSTTMGTVIDKARLLKGESTVITEQKLANHRWAEEALQKMMREFGMSREEALEQIKEKAPTWAAMLM
jgi:transposase-like protein